MPAPKGSDLFDVPLYDLGSWAIFTGALLALVIFAFGWAAGIHQGTTWGPGAIYLLVALAAAAAWAILVIGTLLYVDTGLALLVGALWLVQFLATGLRRLAWRRARNAADRAAGHLVDAQPLDER